MNYRRAIDAVQDRLWPRTKAIAATKDTAVGRDLPSEKDLRAILIGLMVPLGMTVLNMTMFGVALPAIRDSFAIEADTAAWLVSAYSLPFVVFMPFYGRLGDGLGKRRLFSIGIIIFFVGTFLCLTANDFVLLILGRMLQGVGTGGVNPLCLAVITDLFPAKERGRAMATWSSTGPATGMLGPILGGLLIDSFGWQSMFWMGMLASVAALWFVRGYVPKLQPKAVSGFLQKFDWIGMVLLSSAIILLVAYLSSRSLTGVEPLLDWRLALATLLFAGGFWLWERRCETPLISFDLFTVPNFGRSSLVATLRMVLMSCQSFLIPLFLADIYGAPGTQIGVLLTLQAALLLATVRYGGRMADRWSRRWPVMIGFGIQALAMAYFAYLPPNLPLWWPVIGMILHGGGGGLSLAVLHRLALDNVPANRSGSAAGLYSMIRFFGSIIGATVGGVILTQALNYYENPVDAYHVTFLSWAVVGVIAIVAIFPVRDKTEDTRTGNMG